MKPFKETNHRLDSPIIAREFRSILDSPELIDLYSKYALLEHLEAMKPILLKILIVRNWEVMKSNFIKEKKESNDFDEETDNAYSILTIAKLFRELSEAATKQPELKITLLTGLKKTEKISVDVYGHSFVEALSDMAASYAYEALQIRYKDETICNFVKEKTKKAGFGSGVSFNDAYYKVESEIEEFVEFQRDAAIQRAYIKATKAKKTGRPTSMSWLAKPILALQKYLQVNNTALKSDAKIISQKQAEFIFNLLTFLYIIDESDKTPGFEGADYIRAIIANTRRKSKV